MHEKLDDSRGAMVIGWWRLAAVACVVVGTVIPARAQQNDETPGVWTRFNQTMPAGLAGEDSDGDGFMRRTANGVKELWSSGHNDLFVPGYIWHMPWRYSDEQIAHYNTLAWGAGFGRTMVDANGHPRTLLAMVSADSYNRPQYMAAYTWRAKWRPGGGALSLGGGYAALVIGRADRFHYTPIPLALPLGSIGTDRFEIQAAYVPGFEVSYLFARVRVN